MSDFLENLGTVRVPQLFGYLNSKGAMSLMNILRDTTASDGAGGRIKSTATAVNASPIECSVSPKRTVGDKGEHGEMIVSTNEYVISFAAVAAGVPIAILSSDRIQVLASTTVPVRLFRITDLKNSSGVEYQAICELENNK